MSDPGEDPLPALARLQRLLEEQGVRDVTVTGSAALGVWATPRQSRDIDVCAFVPMAAVAPLLARFDGIAAGPSDMPDVLRLRFGNWDIDIFVNGDDPYDRVFTDRAVAIPTAAGVVKIVTREDLLIHKMIKLRNDRRRLLQDLADMRALTATGSIDSEYIRKWLPVGEADTVDALASADDEQLARRILGP